MQQTYSHGQELFPKLFSKITMKLGEQLLSMTVALPYSGIEKPCNQSFECTKMTFDLE